MHRSASLSTAAQEAQLPGGSAAAAGPVAHPVSRGAQPPSRLPRRRSREATAAAANSTTSAAAVARARVACLRATLMLA